MICPSFQLETVVFFQDFNQGFKAFTTFLCLKYKNVDVGDLNSFKMQLWEGFTSIGDNIQRRMIGNVFLTPVIERFRLNLKNLSDTKLLLNCYLKMLKLLQIKMSSEQGKSIKLDYGKVPLVYIAFPEFPQYSQVNFKEEIFLENINKIWESKRYGEYIYLQKIFAKILRSVAKVFLVMQRNSKFCI